MPAPPPESEPAIVSATGMVTAPARVRVRQPAAPWARNSERGVDNLAQLAGGGRRVRGVRQGGNHRNAIGARRDHRLGVRRGDAGDRADWKIADAARETPDDCARSRRANGRLAAGLRGGGIDAADADVVDERQRRDRRLRRRCAPRGRGTAMAPAVRALRPPPCPPAPTCTPSASAAIATSTRSLTMSGTPYGASAALSARASSIMCAGIAHLVAQLHQRRAAGRDGAGKFDEVVAAGVFRVDDGINTQIELFHGNNVGEPREQYHASCAKDVSIARGLPPTLHRPA